MHAVIAAPSTLGLQTDGVAGLPDALLAAGLGSLLGARIAGRVEPPPRAAGVDPVTGVRNAAGVAAYARRLAVAVGEVLDRGEFPVVLGGDCSILLGSLLALRRRGRHGLLFLDGHADFYQPDTDPESEAASMELAFATGRGPALLSGLHDEGPLVHDEDVAAFGMRDAAEQAAAGCAPPPAGLRSWDLDQARHTGVARAAAEAVRHVARPDLDGFWVHVDADVVDDALMPAVDYRLAGGLSWEELGTVLATAMGSGRAVGFEVTIYNPELDPDGTAGRALAATIGHALGATTAM
ncbi:arginase family protein [Dactylosporangium sp. NBC_01737]|uniref:arginase family protein n=1 Tax=Dactylosporangium sp. NBC_01737 TaxID=2975959 RepID=UPI002E10623C|nr:arginase family protein [Dactylosporangium sp. NBC_01737]